MKFPAFWSKESATATGPAGQEVSSSCWGWSDVSELEARHAAGERAKRVVERLLRGVNLEHYAYGRGPLREEVLQQITDADGNLTAAVTQNAYGALVLNTARVMFFDIDFPAVGAGEGIKNFFGGLLGKKSSSPEDTARRTVERFVAAHSGFGLRVYRTCAGLRLLATHAVFDPQAESTRQLMESVGTDPLYEQLCRSQGSFRARLTPKPWRCGHTGDPPAWPRTDADAQRRFEAWQREYVRLQKPYATCRFLDSLGSDAIHPEAADIIELHDRLTRSDEQLELA